MVSLRGAASLLLCSLLCPSAAWSASEAADGNEWSGSYRGRVLEERFRHEQALARRSAALTEQAPRRLLEDRGDIAVIDTSGGVVADPNFLDINGLTLRFTPSGSGFAGIAEPLAFNDAARADGIPLELADDDSVRVLLPFAFPFFGESYQDLYVNSDGNLTFREPDQATNERSLPRAIAGPPRIAPYFVDLDPSRIAARVRVYTLSDRVIFTWDGVPQFTAAGTGRRQIFQVELRPDGRIAFHYLTVNLSTAVVAIVPGGGSSVPAAVDLSVGFGPVPGGFAELFQLAADLDLLAAGLSFYSNHDDAYDFIVLFNNFGLTPGPGAFAFEVNVRNDILGIGDLLFEDPIFDLGPEFGSPRRLASFVNMGSLSAYPADPTANIPLIGENSTLSVMSHEVGHRWLAYIDFENPATGAISGDLLGRQDAHWSFFFDSEASFVEGNRIQDNGAGASPRFVTTGAVSAFSPLDQYIMGLISPSEVASVFLVEDVRNTSFPSASRPPQTGVSFDGVRTEVTVDSIVAAEGPRRPDHTVSEKEFRLAFVLLIDDDSPGPSDADIAKIDGIRRAWEPFFEQALMGRADAVTTLDRKLELSAWPSAGVLLGQTGRATVSIGEPLAVDLTVALSSDSPAASPPSTVTVPAGETSAAFLISGDAPGVSVIRAEALEAGFEISHARVRVLASASDLRIAIQSGAGQEAAPGEPLPAPVVVRVTDANRTPFVGVPLEVVASGDGQAALSTGVTGPDGRATISWTLATAGLNALRIAIPDSGVEANVLAGSAGQLPAFSAAGVVNAAVLATADGTLSPGSLATVFGVNLAAQTDAARNLPLPRELAGAQAFVNGAPAPLLYASPEQINFLLPFGLAGDSVSIVVSASTGQSAPVEIGLATAQPGVFFDAASGRGAIRFNADGMAAVQRPARAGEFVEIYATGLGPVMNPPAAGEPASSFFLSETLLDVVVRLDGQSIAPLFSGLAPTFSGLYQVNIQLPADLAPGTHQLAIEVAGVGGNTVEIVSE